MAKVSAVKHTHTHTTKVGERMIDLLPQQEHDSDSKRQNKNVLNNETCIQLSDFKKNAFVTFNVCVSVTANSNDYKQYNTFL